MMSRSRSSRHNGAPRSRIQELPGSRTQPDIPAAGAGAGAGAGADSAVGVDGEAGEATDMLMQLGASAEGARTPQRSLPISAATPDGSRRLGLPSASFHTRSPSNRSASSVASSRGFRRSASTRTGMQRTASVSSLVSEEGSPAGFTPFPDEKVPWGATSREADIEFSYELAEEIRCAVQKEVHGTVIRSLRAKHRLVFSVAMALQVRHMHVQRWHVHNAAVLTNCSRRRGTRAPTQAPRNP